MHPCLGNWVAIGRAVKYYSQAAHTFRAGIKCLRCSYDTLGNEKVEDFNPYAADG